MDDDSVKLAGMPYLRIMAISPNYQAAENLESVVFSDQFFKAQTQSVSDAREKE